MIISCYTDLRHRMKGTYHEHGKASDADGMIVVHNGNKFFLSNHSEYDGAFMPYKRGYRYSWVIETICRFDFALFETEKHEILRSRLKLLVGLQKLDHIDERMLLRTKIREDKERLLAFSFTDPGKVSYASKPELRYVKNSRTRTTFGRYVRRQLAIETSVISDNSLKAIAADLFAFACDIGSDDFRVISGRDIVDTYRDCVGGCSCMTGDDANKTELYAINDNISMLIYKDMARALLWKCDCGTKVMDRIYPNDGSHVSAMRKWAYANGYMVRVNNSFPSSGSLLEDDNFYKVTVKIPDLWPYMDTFRYAISYNNRTAVLSNERRDHAIMLDSTCGEGPCSDGECTYTCSHCGERVSDSDDLFGPDCNLCESCCSDLYATCNYCGEYVNVDEVVTIADEGYCTCCAECRFELCDRCRDYYKKGTLCHVEDIEEYWCEDCISDHAWMCAGCKSYFTEDGCETCNDGETRCAACHSICDSCGAAFGNDDIRDGLCKKCCAEESQHGEGGVSDEDPSPQVLPEHRVADAGDGQNEQKQGELALVS